jgi:hypothetical protein
MSDRNLIRIEIEQTTPYSLTTVWGDEIKMPRSRAIRWELVLVKYGVLDDGVGNISSIVMEVKATQAPSSAPLISKSTSSINTGLTEAQRQTRTDQHAVIEFAAGDTGLNMGSADTLEKTFDLVITATRNGNLVTLARVPFTVVNDGGQYSGNTPTAGDPEYYTKAETNGLIAHFIKPLNDPGVAIILVSPDGQWQRRLAVNNNGELTWDVSGPPA